MEILYLTPEDVLATGITNQEFRTLVAGALAQHGRKKVENPPKPGIHPLPQTFLHAMPAYLEETREAGIKWVSGFFDNPKQNLPAIMGLIVLNDADTGAPTAIIDGGWITNMRTAAVTAVAAEQLAPANVRSIGIVGTGMQARYHMLMMQDMFPQLEVVKGFDIYQPGLESFAEDMKRELNINVQPVSSVSEAVQGSDIVMTCTGVLKEPIFFWDDVKPGALVLPVHGGGWEFDVMNKADVLITDSHQQVASFLDGKYNIPESSLELGEVVADLKPGRVSQEQRILNFNLGLAIHDIAIAHRVCELAREKGQGVNLPYDPGVYPVPGAKK
ncbi:ornithine cyclodeaminase family protein [Spongorhabdus nitratireducens]